MAKRRKPRLRPAKADAKRKAGNGPGHDGRRELGIREVEDPLEPGAKLQAAVNVRASVIEHLRARKRLDPSQVAAGERFAELWQRAAIGGRGGGELREKVDGGQLADPQSNAVIDATRELAQAIERSGPIGSLFLIKMVGEGQTIAEVARGYRLAGGIAGGVQAAQGYVVGRLAEALDALVDHWRLLGIGKRPKGKMATVTVTGRPGESPGILAAAEVRQSEIEAVEGGGRRHRITVQETIRAERDPRPIPADAPLQRDLGGRRGSEMVPRYPVATLRRLLRTRRGDRPLRAFAEEVGIGARELSRFDQGAEPDQATYDKICLWLGRAEERQREAG